MLMEPMFTELLKQLATRKLFYEDVEISTMVYRGEELLLFPTYVSVFLYVTEGALENVTRIISLRDGEFPMYVLTNADGNLLHISISPTYQNHKDYGVYVAWGLR